MRRLFLVFGLALLPPVAHATVLLPADFKELVDGSRAILHATVVDVRPEWRDGRRYIDTLVTVEVAQYLKGDLGETVTFRVPGGVLGNYRSIVVGAPTFAEGDEVVLFLTARGPSVPYVFGLNQGVFRVVADSRTGGKVVTPPALLAAGAGQRIVRGAAARRPVPLQTFGAQVRDVVAGRNLDESRTPDDRVKGRVRK
jgi:hypothetical protein